MAVREVLPVSSQLITECQQLRLLQHLNAFQDLALGVRAFKWQVEVVQQPAEQAAIEQAEGFPWLRGPQLLGAAGDIVG